MQNLEVRAHQGRSFFLVYELREIVSTSILPSYKSLHIATFILFEKAEEGKKYELCYIGKFQVIVMKCQMNSVKEYLGGQSQNCNQYHNNLSSQKFFHLNFCQVKLSDLLNRSPVLHVNLKFVQFKHQLCHCILTIFMYYNLINILFNIGTTPRFCTPLINFHPPYRVIEIIFCVIKICLEFEVIKSLFLSLRIYQVFIRSCNAYYHKKITINKHRNVYVFRTQSQQQHNY